MILIADIGASKTLVALGEMRDGVWQAQHEGRYPDDGYTSFAELLRSFFQDNGIDAKARSGITAACFGLAGPVSGSAATLTNRSWNIDGSVLAAEFGIPRPLLLNDVAAAAHGLPALRGEDLVTLQTGEPVPHAPRAVISVGTGYNAAYLIKDGNDYQVLCGEAGHVPFAPTTFQEFELRQWLATDIGEVTVEDLISGRGIVNLYRYVLSQEARSPWERPAAHDSIDAAAIVKSAETGDPGARRALDLFAEIFGRIAGDQVLSLLPPGGLFIAGGVPPRMLTASRQGRFMAAFRANRKFAALAGRIAVHLVLKDDLVLRGCMRFAANSR